MAENPRSPYSRSAPVANPKRVRLDSLGQLTGRAPVSETSDDKTKAA